MQLTTTVLFVVALFELLSYSIHHVISSFKHVTKIIIETKSGAITVDPDNEESIRALIKKVDEGENEDLQRDIQNGGANT